MRFALLAAVALPLASGIAASSVIARPTGVARPSGVAVVELFTSEGCSSCPPADRLLADIASEATRGGQPVFALSFHVDYWNGLGWADPFSRPAYSERQKSYADALGGGVYTPEMIVNGRAAFVGSDAARARSEVRLALGRPAAARFERLRALGKDGIVQVTFAVAGAPPGSLIRVALVHPDTAVAVRRGENGGRRLAHHGVVAAFATLRLDAGGNGESRLPLPAGARAEALRAVIYAQNPESLEVLGAAETGIGAG
ncbi:MAG: DUF1223 domain-containing protein [Fibrobacteres bacterium]|nr:DUF1223 domain-containing protein [Fibrobacterota bacterium]